MARGVFQSDRTRAPTAVGRDIARRQRCEVSKRGHDWAYWGEDGRDLPDQADTDDAAGRTCRRCDHTQAKTRNGEYL
jgi:hypothetical protein